MPAFDKLLTPAVEQQHPRLWLGAAMAAAIPVRGFRGPEAFIDLVMRCESRAVGLDDPYFHAMSRWLLGMSLDTDRELLRQARDADQPYVVALATIRLAIDTPLDEPDDSSRGAAGRRSQAAAYHSRYIREYCRAARRAGTGIR